MSRTVTPDTSTTLLRDVASSADNARWGEFVSRYRGMMFAYLKSRFPALDADDIVQETLIALAAALPRYRYEPSETGRFRNYLTGILRNKALKRCEKAAREEAAKEGLRLVAPPSPTMDGGEEEWRSAALEIAMRQLLSDDRIHERSKQIFQRLAVDGESPDAVAAAYGMNRNGVDKIKSRMIGHLCEIVRALEAAGNA